MDLLFAQLALAALGGASGSIGEAAARDLWRRLRDRFSSDSQTLAILDGQNSNDPNAVTLLGEAIHREAATDPEFRREVEEWLALASGPAGHTVNSVRDSQGINAPGATFNSPVHMSIERREQAE